MTVGERTVVDPDITVNDGWPIGALPGPRVDILGHGEIAQGVDDIARCVRGTHSLLAPSDVLYVSGVVHSCAPSFHQVSM